MNVCMQVGTSVYNIAEQGMTCFPKDDNAGIIHVPFMCITCKLLCSEFTPTSSEPQITHFTKRLVTLPATWWETGKAICQVMENKTVTQHLVFCTISLF